QLDADAVLDLDGAKERLVRLDAPAAGRDLEARAVDVAVAAHVERQRGRAAGQLQLAVDVKPVPHRARAARVASRGIAGAAQDAGMHRPLDLGALGGVVAIGLHDAALYRADH